MFVIKSQSIYDKIFLYLAIILLCLSGCMSISKSSADRPFEINEKESTVFPSTFGKLIIYTSPQNARVLIDGKYISNKTPITVRIKQGKHTLLVERGTEYATEEKLLNVGGGKTQSIKIKLEPNYGKFSILFEPKDAKIFIDGKFMGEKSPLMIDKVEQGEYSVRIEKEPDYIAQENDFNIIGGEIKSIRIKLQRNYGTLSISSEPNDAKIFIDGKFMGKKSPLIIDKVIQGEYSVRIEKEPDYIAQENDFSIIGGENKSIKIKLVSVVRLGNCIPDKY